MVAENNIPIPIIAIQTAIKKENPPNVVFSLIGINEFRINNGKHVRKIKLEAYKMLALSLENGFLFSPSNVKSNSDKTLKKKYINIQKK